MFLLPRTIKALRMAGRRTRVIKWGSLGLVTLAAVEALLYAALMFNILARFDPKYLAVESNPMAPYCDRIARWEKSRTNGSGGNSMSRSLR